MKLNSVNNPPHDKRDVLVCSVSVDGKRIYWDIAHFDPECRFCKYNENRCPEGDCRSAWWGMNDRTKPDYWIELPEISNMEKPDNK